MMSPKIINQIVFYLCIERINRACLLSKRKIASDHCKQYRSTCKHIYFLWRIDLSKQNLWSHVLLRSSVSLGHFFSRRKSKIANFEVEILINKQILHFEISVEDPFSLHKIKTWDELLKEISCIILRQSFISEHNVK